MAAAHSERLVSVIVKMMTAVVLFIPLFAMATAGAGEQEKGVAVLADMRLEKPVQVIVDEFQGRMGTKIRVQFASADEVNTAVEKGKANADVVLCMTGKKAKTAVNSLPGAKRVAWKYPGGDPVWAATLTKHPQADALCRFVGGPTGHLRWSQSPAGFTITTGKTHAEAFDWVVRNRVGHTYPMTAMRMLRECGGIREGICIDVGCGTGNLDVELAKRSKLTIIGLDIDPDMKPLFEKRVREAKLQKRLSFVVGDAQKMPFPDNHADMIVSRGTLTFIPDIGKCLKEVDRVLKPTGVAFLGGRYLYTPQKHKITNEKLQQIVRDSGVPAAQVITDRGQWVKIIGPKAPEAARGHQGGPHLLVHRCIADYAIAKGKCLLICRGDGGLEQGMQWGFVQMTEMDITALYPSEKVAAKARKRIDAAKQSKRITCKVGTVHAIPFDESSFDMIAGVGPILLWGEREKGMKELYRVLRPGGAALVGGKYLYMPEFRKTSSATLRASAAKTGIGSIRVIDDMGQWIEIRKGVSERPFRD